MVVVKGTARSSEREDVAERNMSRRVWGKGQGKLRMVDWRIIEARRGRCYEPYPVPGLR